MRFAGRLDKVKPSVTLGLNARTLELKNQGKDIISLGVGEPDIDAPDLVSRVGIEAIEAHRGRYTATAGIPELRQAISEYVGKVYGLTYSTDCVMASSGAKQVLFNSILATAGEGDEVIIPTPYWTSYPEMVHLACAKPVCVETTLADGLKLKPEKLAGAITPRTTALLLNSPSNPSGVTYTRRELEGLAEVLAPHDIWILSDDIYCTLLYGNTEGNQLDRDTSFHCMAELPGFRDRTILINGVSKTFSMTGWRIGFAAGSLEAIKAMTRFQDHSTSCPNAIAQYAAAAALRAGPGLTAEWQAKLATRRDLMVSLVREIPGTVVVPPTGAFYLFVDVNHYLGGRFGNTLDLAEGLLVDGGVGTIPGEAFGAPGFLRLSFAVDEKAIRDGIARMHSFLTK